MRWLSRHQTFTATYTSGIQKYLRYSSSRSILLQPGNSILNPRLNALSKRKPTKEDTNDANDVWKNDPYLTMLASPLRKCIWSNRVMPRDFMIPLKAASIPSPEGKQSKITIFPRSLLHPRLGFESAEAAVKDSKGHKAGRAYIVCRKSAVLDFASGTTGKRLDPALEKNPLLVHMIESQLRRRIVQELQALQVGLLHGPITPENASTRSQITVEDAALANLSIGLDDSESITSSRSGEDPSVLPPSSLLIAKGNRWASLATHYAPSYNLRAIFWYPRLHEAKSTKLSKSIPFPATYDQLSEHYPEAFARESALCKELWETACQILQQLADSWTTNIVANEDNSKGFVVLRGHSDVVPLLISLWRWRMWTGEGWESPQDGEDCGFGFGVTEARG